MRKLIVALFVLTATLPAFSQTSETKKPATKKDIVSRAGDHFMIQFAQNIWSNAPDSISSRTKSLNRSANIYLMLDKPFKGDRRFSVGLGIGFGTSNMYFKNTFVNITASNPVLPFIKADTINHYKKYKVSTAYLQVPVEFRFTANPSNPNKSWKGALGLKVGTLLNAHTKGKNLLSGTGTQINSFTEKLASKSYFNSTELAATARVGYGILSLYGSYNLTPIFKDGVSADMKLIQVGLTISGL